MPSDSGKLDELLAVAGRIERAQVRFVTVAEDLLAGLQAQAEKVDAILEAATKEPGPSPTAELLKRIIASLTEQSDLLHALPVSMAQAIRDQMDQELEAQIDAEGEAAWEPAPHPQ